MAHKFKAKGPSPTAPTSTTSAQPAKGNQEEWQTMTRKKGKGNKPTSTSQPSSSYAQVVALKTPLELKTPSLQPSSISKERYIKWWRPSPYVFVMTQNRGLLIYTKLLKSKYAYLFKLLNTIRSEINTKLCMQFIQKMLILAQHISFNHA